MLACLFERNTIASPHLPRVGLHMGSVRDRDLDPPNQGPACPRGHLTPVHPRRGPWLISRRRSATTKRPGLLPPMSHCSESRHLGSVFFSQHAFNIEAPSPILTTQTSPACHASAPTDRPTCRFRRGYCKRSCGTRPWPRIRPRSTAGVCICLHAR